MKTINAVLYSNICPSEEQEAKILEFLEHKYGDVNLSFIKDTNIKAGFILEVGSDIYDWTTKGRLEQLIKEIAAIDKNKNIFKVTSINIKGIEIIFSNKIFGVHKVFQILFKISIIF